MRRGAARSKPTIVERLRRENTQLKAERQDVLEGRVMTLRCALSELVRVVRQETEDHTFGKPSYDITLDHLHEAALTAREVLYDEDGLAKLAELWPLFQTFTIEPTS